VVAAVFLIRFTIDIGLIGPELRMVAAALFGSSCWAWRMGAHRKRVVDDPRIAQAWWGPASPCSTLPSTAATSCTASSASTRPRC
jgi:hypothetical protein